MIVYKHFRIIYLGAGHYRVGIGRELAEFTAHYDGGIMEVINEIDYIINLLKGGNK